MSRSLSVLVDWRRVLIYTHRWLGVAGCLVFLVWFVSGIVMMYERMPRLTAEERLARLTELDVSRIRIPLADAARAAPLTPDRVRVGMLGERPVYRLEAGGVWTTVFADTGELLRSLSAREAVQIIKRFMPEHTSSVSDAGRLEQPDQWTLDGGLPRFLPMHRISLGDADGTYIYVSERTGEPVMKTTARGRFWGYMGAVLHWTYFTPFRQQRELWRYSIIYAALIGCAMCLSGLVIGVWRFSPSKRFRLKHERSHSPYAGLMWWHHYAGLVFGLFSFTWALSGALSLTPWDWVPSTGPTDFQRATLSGGDLRLDLITPARIQEAVRAVDSDFAPKELEVLQFRGRPFAMAYRAPTLTQGRQATNPDVTAIFSPQLALDRRLVWLDERAVRTFDRLEPASVSESVHAAMPNVPVTDARWLTTYDGYYYDRWNAKPLPVLRVRYEDADRTWLYVDPQSGLIVLRHTSISRLNRWLYNGLHSLDFSFLYYSRPAWDIVVAGLSLGGIALSVTTMLPACRRLRRHWRAARWAKTA
jgi:hypothetical protein